MKLPLLILIGCAATSLAQVAPYDKLAPDNVTMRLEGASGNMARIGPRGSSGRSGRSYTAGNKAIDVSISPVGSNAAPVILEFYVITETPGYVAIARLVEKQQADFGAARKCHFDFGKFDSLSTKGWVVRAVRENRVVGYVASGFEYEKFATDTALLDQYVKQKPQPTAQQQKRLEKDRERYGLN